MPVLWRTAPERSAAARAATHAAAAAERIPAAPVAALARARPPALLYAHLPVQVSAALLKFLYTASGKND